MNDKQDGLLHEQRRARRPNTDKRLRRSKDERVLAGVVGGVAEFIDVSPVNLRWIFVLSIILTAGFMLIAYGLLWLLLPVE